MFEDASIGVGGTEMDTRPINTEASYREVLEMIESLMLAEPDTPEGEKLDAMVTLVEACQVPSACCG